MKAYKTPTNPTYQYKVYLRHLTVYERDTQIIINREIAKDRNMGVLRLEKNQ